MPAHHQGFYRPHYTDLERAIKELGTVTVRHMVNRHLRDRGMARKRIQAQRAQRLKPRTGTEG